MELSESIYVVTDEVNKEGFPLATDLGKAKGYGAVILSRSPGGWLQRSRSGLYFHGG